MGIPYIHNDITRAKKQITHQCYGETCQAQISLRRKFCIECAVERMDNHRRLRKIADRRAKAAGKTA